MVYLKLFPSLTGVIHFLIMVVKKLYPKIWTVWFPSLTGVIHFLITVQLYGTKKTISVSVPYRGYSFFNPTP